MSLFYPSLALMVGSIFMFRRFSHKSIDNNSLTLIFGDTFNKKDLETLIYKLENTQPGNLLTLEFNTIGGSLGIEDVIKMNNSFADAHKRGIKTEAIGTMAGSMAVLPVLSCQSIDPDMIIWIHAGTFVIGGSFVFDESITNFQRVIVTSRGADELLEKLISLDESNEIAIELTTTLKDGIDLISRYYIETIEHRIVDSELEKERIYKILVDNLCEYQPSRENDITFTLSPNEDGLYSLHRTANLPRDLDQKNVNTIYWTEIEDGDELANLDRLMKILINSTERVEGHLLLTINIFGLILKVSLPNWLVGSR